MRPYACRAAVAAASRGADIWFKLSAPYRFTPATAAWACADVLLTVAGAGRLITTYDDLNRYVFAFAGPRLNPTRRETTESARHGRTYRLTVDPVKGEGLGDFKLTTPLQRLNIPGGGRAVERGRHGKLSDRAEGAHHQRAKPHQQRIGGMQVEGQ